MRRTLFSLLASMGIAAAGLLGGSTSASAASGDRGYVFAGTPIYNCASRVCTYNRVTQFDAWIPFQCYQDSGTPVERWFKVLNNNLWIQSFRVDNVNHKQPSLPPC